MLRCPYLISISRRENGVLSPPPDWSCSRRGARLFKAGPPVQPRSAMQGQRESPWETTRLARQGLLLRYGHVVGALGAESRSGPPADARRAHCLHRHRRELAGLAQKERRRRCRLPAHKTAATTAARMPSKASRPSPRRPRSVGVAAQQSLLLRRLGSRRRPSSSRTSRRNRPAANTTVTAGRFGAAPCRHLRPRPAAPAPPTHDVALGHSAAFSGASSAVPQRLRCPRRSRGAGPGRGGAGARVHDLPPRDRTAEPLGLDRPLHQVGARVLHGLRQRPWATWYHLFAGGVKGRRPRSRRG